jgi:thiol-disulfide isomerase/thioredoxin
MSLSILIFTIALLVLVISCMVLYLFKTIINSSKKAKLLRSEDGFKKGALYPLQSLKTINGNSIEKMKNVDGLVLIITSYGCDACKRVYPYLEQLRGEHKNLQFQLLMLANKEQALENIKLFKLESFSVSLIQQEQLHDLGITGFPFSYLLSNEGKVIEKGLVNHKKDFDLLISFLPIKKIS